MNKNYYQMDNIGEAKYTINFHDGESTHRSDGSPFYDICIFSNKAKMQKFVKELQEKGYKGA